MHDSMSGSGLYQNLTNNCLSQLSAFRFQLGIMSLLAPSMDGSSVLKSSRVPQSYHLVIDILSF
jgi:hypothetical protein